MLRGQAPTSPVCETKGCVGTSQSICQHEITSTSPMNIYKYCPSCGTPLKTATIENRTRKTCPSCSWIHYENPLPVALAYTVNQSGKLLVVRRAHPPAYNAWALPGGFIESGETPQEGCLRELREETSLNGRIDRLIGAYHRESEMYGSLLAVAYKVIVSDDTLQINHELYEADFYSCEEIPRITIPLHRKVIEDVRDHESRNTEENIPSFPVRSERIT